jgi:hypothetical protein
VDTNGIDGQFGLGAISYSGGWTGWTSVGYGANNNQFHLTK